MLSRRCPWSSLSARHPVFSRHQPISSTPLLADSPKDANAGPSTGATQKLAHSRPNLSLGNHQPSPRPSSASLISDSRHLNGYPSAPRPGSASIRHPSGPTSPSLQPARPGYPPFRPDQRHPASHPRQPTQAANFQAPDRSQPPFFPPNPYGQAHPKPSGYYPPPGALPPWGFRTPPINQQSSPNAAPQFFQPHPSPPSFQPRQGLSDQHLAEGKRFYPQFHTPYPVGHATAPSPSYMSHPSNARAQSAPPHQGWMMFPQAASATEVPHTSPVPQTPSSQISISRSRKISQPRNNLDFDLQDLAGGDALHRFAQNSNATAHPASDPSKAFSNHSVHRPLEAGYEGRHLASPQSSERWRSNVFTGPAAYSNPSHGQNFNPRNPNRKESYPAVRDRLRPTGNTRRSLGPSRTPRARGRGLLEFASGPSLPPPPKTVLDERGEFGIEPAPSGIPQSIPHTLSTPREKKSVDEDLPTDYRAISKLIAASNIGVKLPGLNQSVQFEHSKLLQSSQSCETTWAHGEAKRDQIVKRAFDLVIKNPSLNVEQKRGTVALVDFLLMSREERVAKIKSSD